MSATVNALPRTLQSAVPLPQATANAALQAAARQAAALLRAVPAGDAPIPHSEWTVAEAAIHLVAGVRVYLGCARGGPRFVCRFDQGTLNVEPATTGVSPSSPSPTC